MAANHSCCLRSRRASGVRGVIVAGAGFCDFRTGLTKDIHDVVQAHVEVRVFQLLGACTLI